MTVSSRPSRRALRPRRPAPPIPAATVGALLLGAALPLCVGCVRSRHSAYVRHLSTIVEPQPRATAAAAPPESMTARAATDAPTP